LDELRSGGYPLRLLLLPRIVYEHGNEYAQEYGKHAALEHLHVTDYDHYECLCVEGLAVTLVWIVIVTNVA
jgi:hypothetical protein